jgi:hypothetical protein
LRLSYAAKPIAAEGTNCNQTKSDFSQETRIHNHQVHELCRRSLQPKIKELEKQQLGFVRSQTLAKKCTHLDVIDAKPSK